MSPRLLRPRAAVSTEFDPRQISGMRLWLDGADASSVTLDGPTASEWRDKSGSGFHASQPTASSQPTFSANQIGGRSALVFGSGGVKTMETPVFWSSQPVTAFVVVRKDSTANANIFDAGGSQAGGRQYLFGSTNIEYGSSNVVVTTSVPFGASPRLLTVRLNSASSFIRVNGVQTANVNGGTAMTQTGYRFGAFNAASSGLVGAIGEVLFYGTLSAQEISAIEQYLAAKWSIALTTPPAASNAEAQDWINRVYLNGGTVSATTANAVNTFCNSIDAAGIRDRFLRLNLFCGNSDASLNAVRTPLYRGASLTGTQLGNAMDTNVNFQAGDYSESSGLAGNASNKWLDTGLPQNFATSRHMMVVPHTMANLNTYLMGAWGPSGNQSIFGFFAASISPPAITFFNANDSATLGSAAGSVVLRRSFIGVSDPGGSGLAAYVDGAIASTGAAHSTSNTGTVTIFGMKRSSSSTPDFLNGSRLSAYSLGLSMTASQCAALNNALTAFGTALVRA